MWRWRQTSSSAGERPAHSPAQPLFVCPGAPPAVIVRRVEFVDLSVPIRQSPEDTLPALRTDIELSGHAAGAAVIEQLFGVPPEMLRDGEGWANEEFTRFGTHNSTHVDAPWHYNSTIQGKPAQTIDELPLEWFHADGVVLEMSHKSDGDAVTAAEVESELERIGHVLSPLDIVLVRTGRDAFYRRSRLHGARARRDRRGDAMALRARRPRHGHRRLGLGRPAVHAGPAGAESGEPGIFWAAHQVDLPYSQIERLANLGALPPTGFKVACFPLRIEGASAAPARVVAMVP